MRFKDIEPTIHPTAFVTADALVIGDVHIGEDSSVWFSTVVRGDVNFIRIGARTNIQDGTIIHVTSKIHPTILEDEITVGHRAVLHGCHIESRCLIGIGAIVMDGVRVGRDSLVGAGSLLTPGTQFPPRSMILGSPARVKRELTDDEVGKLDRTWRNYVELVAHYR